MCGGGFGGLRHIGMCIHSYIKYKPFLIAQSGLPFDPFFHLLLYNFHIVVVAELKCTFYKADDDDYYFYCCCCAVVNIKNSL